MDTSAAPPQGTSAAAAAASSVETAMVPYSSATSTGPPGPGDPIYAGETLGGNLGMNSPQQAQASAQETWPPLSAQQREISDWLVWAIYDFGRLDRVLSRHGPTLFALQEWNNLHQPEDELEARATINSLQELIGISRWLTAAVERHMLAFGEPGVTEHVNPAEISQYNNYLTAMPTWPSRWHNSVAASLQGVASTGIPREVILQARAPTEHLAFEPRPPPGPPPGWTSSIPQVTSSTTVPGYLVAVTAANMASQAAADAAQAAASSRNAAAWANLAITSSVGTVAKAPPLVVTLTQPTLGRPLAVPPPANPWGNYRSLTLDIPPSSRVGSGRNVAEILNLQVKSPPPGLLREVTPKPPPLGQMATSPAGGSSQSGPQAAPPPGHGSPPILTADMPGVPSPPPLLPGMVSSAAAAAADPTPAPSRPRRNYGRPQPFGEYLDGTEFTLDYYLEPKDCSLKREPRVSSKAAGKGTPLAPVAIPFSKGDFAYRFWMGDLPLGTNEDHDLSASWNNLSVVISCVLCVTTHV